MIRTIVTALAASALVVLGAGVANADPIADQCARATIPTALCNGSGGSTGGTDVGNVRYVDHGKYLSGYGADKVLGYQDGAPILDEAGNPVLDDNGDPTYVQVPITAAGDPIFSTYPQAQPGQKDSDGNTVRDLSGYTYK